IRRLLERAPDSAAATALAFVQAAVSHSRDRDDVEIVDEVEGCARLGVRPSDRTAGELESLGIIEALPDGRWRILAPAAFSAAQELAAFGVPADRRLEVTQLLRAHTEAMAEVVTELFVEHLWRPSTRGDRDPDWVALTSAIARLRPLATTTVAAFFDDALGRAAATAGPGGGGPGSGRRGVGGGDGGRAHAGAAPGHRRGGHRLVDDPVGDRPERVGRWSVAQRDRHPGVTPGRHGRLQGHGAEQGH